MIKKFIISLCPYGLVNFKFFRKFIYFSNYSRISIHCDTINEFCKDFNNEIDLFGFIEETPRELDL